MGWLRYLSNPTRSPCCGFADRAVAGGAGRRATIRSAHHHIRPLAYFDPPQADPLRLGLSYVSIGALSLRPCAFTALRCTRGLLGPGPTEQCGPRQLRGCRWLPVGIHRQVVAPRMPALGSLAGKVAPEYRAWPARPMGHPRRTSGTQERPLRSSWHPYAPWQEKSMSRMVVDTRWRQARRLTSTSPAIAGTPASVRGKVSRRSGSVRAARCDPGNTGVRWPRDGPSSPFPRRSPPV